MLPPTSYLPPIKSIGNHPLESLENAVRYLRSIYSPQVRGSCRRRRDDVYKQDGGEGAQYSVLESLRTDAFERGYSIKWLTALISQCGEDLEEDEDGTESTPSTKRSQKEILVEGAASLLATCAGTASAGIITRRFEFDLVSQPGSPICVQLTDVPLDNQDYGSVGAQTWGGACIMAEMMAEDPDAFYLPWSREYSLRCLELGAGTGLVSLTAAKIIERANQPQVNVEIVATDYYPSVLANLAQNVQSNSTHVATRHLDWSTFPESDPVFDQGFDVVYGADIIYEAQHATWIKSCLMRLLRKPSSFNPEPTFHLIIPLRATHSVESNTIEQVFPVKSSHTVDELVIKHKDIIICDVESDKDGEEIEYAYYKIGWS